MAGTCISLVLLGMASVFYHVQGQQIACVADIGIVIDHSGSIRDAGEENWGILLKFINDLINSLNPGQADTQIRLAAVGFGNKGTLYFKLGQYSRKQQYIDHINGLENKGGNTNTTGGLKVMWEQCFDGAPGDRSSVRDLLILITDGKPTYDKELLPEQIRKIKGSGAAIIGVGVTNQVNETQMREIVSQPADNFYISVEDFSDLDTILQNLISQACATLRPPSSTPSPTPRPSPSCKSGGDIAFVIDTSGSIGEPNFAYVRSFVKTVVDNLPLEDGSVRVAIETFSTQANMRIPLNGFNSRASMTQRIQDLAYDHGTTNTAAALRMLYQQVFTSNNGDRNGSPNIAIVLTDGGSNMKSDTIKEALEAKKRGIHLIVIGVGGWLDNQELLGIASHPYEKNKFDVPNFSSLETITGTMRSLVCNSQDDCISSPCANGGFCQDEINHYVCLCRPGFAGINCEIPCRKESDVVFTLDKSGSIGKQNFRRQLDFVRNMVMDMNLNGWHRVGFETFSDSSTIHFHMNAFQHPVDVINQLNVYYDGGTTNTGGAIRMARTSMFTTENGRRRGDVASINIVITDGKSNDNALTWTESRASRLGGIYIIPVAIGNNVRERELQDMASDPIDKNILRVNDFLTLNTIRSSLLNAVCNVIDECSSSPCRNNGQCTDGINGYTCSCPQGFSGPRCERNCGDGLDIAFVIDASGSIQHERFPLVIDFLTKIVSELSVSEEGTRVGAVKWSDKAELEFTFSTFRNRQDVIQGLRHMKFMGGRTHSASAMAMTNDQIYILSAGDRQNMPDIAIVFTDGGSNIQEQNTIPEAVRLRVAGVHVIVVAVGEDINPLELRGIASEPIDSNLFTMRSYSQLPNFISNVVSATCDDRNECNSGPCRNAGRCEDALDNYVCQCEGGWTGRNCEQRCTRQMDIVFVIDLSGSMDVVYDISIAFTKEVMYGLPYEFGRVRVALVSFHDTANLDYNLLEHSTARRYSELQTTVAFLKTGKGRTNTQEALRMVRQEVFGTSPGNRNVDDIAIVMTDGNSNIRRENTAAQAQQARDEGIELYSIAVGTKVDYGEINAIATDPDSSHVITVETPSGVQAGASELLDALCNN